MNELATLAMGYVGVTEKKGPDYHEWIFAIMQKYLPGITDDGAAAWCSMFVRQLCSELGVEPEVTNAARSWLKVGTAVPLSAIQPGDIPVFWRESKSSWKGHVGVFQSMNWDGDLVITSGNDRNAVTCRAFSPRRLLGIRRLYRETDPLIRAGILFTEQQYAELVNLFEIGNQQEAQKRILQMLSIDYPELLN